MKACIHNFFLSGCLLYLPAAVAGLAGWRTLRNLFFLSAVLFILLSAVVRFYYHWPLMCLFQEPYLISLFVALVAVYLYAKKDKASGIAVGVFSAALSVFTFLFPGDIYISFVKTNSWWAYLFSVSSSLSRAAYLSSGIVALMFLWQKNFTGNDAAMTLKKYGLVRNLIIAGFAFHSLSMFCGALWSYVGWGAPIQWESRLFLGMIGVWFYYSFFLHLHLESGASRKTLLYAAFAGGIFAFVFTFLPDTGVFYFRGFIRWG